MDSVAMRYASYDDQREEIPRTLNRDARAGEAGSREEVCSRHRVGGRERKRLVFLLPSKPFPAQIEVACIRCIGAFFNHAFIKSQFQIHRLRSLLGHWTACAGGQSMRDVETRATSTYVFDCRNW